MTRAASPVQAYPSESFEPEPRRWTRAEYQRLADLGFFNDQRVELLEGEIVPMSPQNEPHVIAADKVAETLRSICPKGTWVRTSAPLDVGANSVPEPDAAIVSGERGSSVKRPSAALLVVEVSHTTLALDRGLKARLYASAGIQEYWIVNLIDRQVEVHRKPLRVRNSPGGRPYAEITVLSEADVIRPLAAPKAKVAVIDLLP